MSQTNATVYCSACGAELAEGAGYCYACGQKIELTEPVSEVTVPEEEITEQTVAFEPEPASTVQEEAETVAVYDEGALLSTPWHLFSNRLVGRALLFVLSLVMLLVSVLAPISTIDVEVDERTYTLSFTSTDTVRIAINSLMKYDEVRMQESPEYEELLLLYEKYEDARRSKQPPIMQQILEKSYYFSLKSQDVPVSYDAIAAALVSVALILLIAACFMAAMIAFAVEICNRFFDMNIKLDAYKPALSLLWISAPLVILLGYVHRQLVTFGAGSPYAETFGATSGKFTLLLVCAIVATLYSVSSFVVPVVKKRGFKPSISALRAIASLAVTVFMIIAIFAPAIKISLASPEDADDRDSITYKAKDLYFTDKNDIQVYVNTPSSTFTSELLSTVSDIFDSKNKEDVETRHFFNDVVMGVGRRNNSGFYIAVQILTELSLILISFLLLALGRRYLFSADCDKAIKWLKALLMLTATALSVIYIVLAIDAASVVNNSYSGVLSYVIKVGIGASPILLLLGSIFMAFTFSTEEKKYIDTDYDNPDVSYAPYVIRARKRQRYQ